jgi:hypothetical protein
MGAARQYNRRELEAFAASRGATVAEGPRWRREAVRRQHGEREAEAGAESLAAVREAVSALAWAANRPEDASEDVCRALRRILQNALQDAGELAVPHVEWKRAWDLWARSWLGPAWVPLDRDRRYYPD